MAPKQKRLRPLVAPPGAFASGARLAERLSRGERPAGRPGRLPATADVEFDLLRPRDLVSLHVRAVHCRLLTAPGKTPQLRPHGDGESLLVVTHAFQHLFEEAVYEEAAPEPGPGGSPPDGSAPPVEPETDPTTLVSPPVRVRAAHGSRVVFVVPDGESIDATVDGLLEAMTRLPMKVHPLAVPGEVRATGTTGSRFVIPLEEGRWGLVEGTLGGIRLTLTDEPASEAGRAPASSPLSGALARAENLNRALSIAAVSGFGLTPGTTVPDALAAFTPGRLEEVGVEIIPLPRSTLSRPPAEDETAIEAPYRVQISPGDDARWVHDPPSEGPVVPLWHSRLARPPAAGSERPDERPSPARTVRAVWARDRDRVGDAWKDASLDTQPASNPLSHADPRDPANEVDPPFLGSLDRADRHLLVRQTSEHWKAKGRGTIAPVPLGADALWLSAWGAWLDLHGAWDTAPYTAQRMSSLLAYDHLAPLGRDQYVRVVYPGYLYPTGHQAALVKVTERKMKSMKPSVAGLYQRMFLVVGERSRTYTDAALPFTRIDVRPWVTPPIRHPDQGGESQDTFFWPYVAGQPFPFTLDAWDAAQRPVRLQTPLMWVSAAYSTAAAKKHVDDSFAAHPAREWRLHDQQLSFVPGEPGTGDGAPKVQSLWLRGHAGDATSSATLSSASVLLPAVQALAPTEALAISYAAEYLEHGLGGTQNPGELWARVQESPARPGEPSSSGAALAFTQPTAPGVPAPGTAKAGGFLSPDLPIRGITRLTGPVGDAAGAAAQDFDPSAFLAGVLPKLFGLIPLEQLIGKVLDAPDRMPQVVSEALGAAQRLVADIERAVAVAEDALAQAQQLQQRAAAKTAELQAQAQQAVDEAEELLTTTQDVAEALATLLGDLPGATPATLPGLADPVFDAIAAEAAQLRVVAALVPPAARTALVSLAEALDRAGAAEDTLQHLVDLVSGLDPAEIEVSFRFDWTPKLQNWPASGGPIFQLTPDTGRNLVLAVEGKASAAGGVKVTATAELRDFTLNLLPGLDLVRIPFDHLAFVAGSSGKAEVDVVMGELQFCGVLSFVETIKDLIPLDGFSDPPYVDVSPSGAVAGFTLGLPSIAVGVFSLSNLALAADVQVPFLGKTVSVGFSFCSRERPFSLTVACLGGGGWFLVRVSPDGLEVLEIGLEAQAVLAVDFGVASGSISAAIGIYIRLEGKEGKLTGYFRLRGVVDVLGLISASIELYLELSYDTKTGKAIGRAVITVAVEVVFFSTSVSIECQRQFAGANNDPSLLEVLDAGTGTSPLWEEYCEAFAAEGAA